MTEIEEHRRRITAQIKREIQSIALELRMEFRSKLDSLDSRLQEQQKAINVITGRLMDLSLYESKLINALKKMNLWEAG